MSVNIAVVGATGQVGRRVLSLLDELNFQFDDLRLFASSNSKGKTLVCRGKEWMVEDVAEQTAASLKGIDIAIFSAGGTLSRQMAPVFEEAGVIVVDNSSAWRGDADIPLVVSEVNPEDLETVFDGGRRIIANPNCTTMAMMPVIKPLDTEYGLVRLRVATYQAVSGGGVKGVLELATQTQRVVEQDFRELAVNTKNISYPQPTKFAEPIAFNVVPYAGNLVNDDSFETDEEQKLRHESRKILHNADLAVGGTCVRVPVFSGHTLVIHAEFSKETDLLRVTELLGGAKGVQLLGNAPQLSNEEIDSALHDEDVPDFARGAEIAGIPTPLKATGIYDSLVGRLRYDQSLPNPKKGLIMVVSSDNLLKGAALNAVQIAQILAERLGPA